MKPNDTYLMEFNDEMHVALADIIQHHQLIIKVVSNLEDIASTFILVKSIQISFQICMLALTFIKVNEINPRINGMLIVAEFVQLKIADLRFLIVQCDYGTIFGIDVVRSLHDQLFGTDYSESKRTRSRFSVRVHLVRVRGSVSSQCADYVVVHD